MPLSEEEQRLLEQMEQALAAEDPKFASALRGASARTRHKRLMILAVLGFLAGIAVLMTGALLAMTVIGVAGFLLMLGSAYVALASWRWLREPELPDNVTPLSRPGGASASRQSGFMNRMEDRWRRRRDDY
ncbi:MAG: DUF3040 domain-containing protein [Nocardioidaceae bacterium]